MTPNRPLAAGDPDPLDLDAAEQLERNDTRRLDLVRARAEKWIGGIAALGGLVTTVLVVKGRDTVADLTTPWRATTAAPLAAALLLLALATYRAYQAAYGDPGTLAQINPIPLTGLHHRLTDARRATATTALAHLAAAIKAALAAIALIALAVGVTWFAPTHTPTQKTCVYDNGQLLLQIAAPSLPVRQTRPGATLRPCP
ncbi:MAG TPA: hypothetical protein VHT30_11700 [Acidimicrobiales bacterium]|jgi:hypothetical protein|nr:hypothetical protein [Acidimicrobiales bacterium]